MTEIDLRKIAENSAFKLKFSVEYRLQLLDQMDAYQELKLTRTHSIQYHNLVSECLDTASIIWFCRETMKG